MILDDHQLLSFYHVIFLIIAFLWYRPTVVLQCLAELACRLLSWRVGSYMILIYDVNHIFTPGQIFPGGKYLNFVFPEYPDLRIHTESLSRYLAYVIHT